VEGLLALDRHGLLAAVWPKLKITPVVRERLYRLQKAADFFETNFPEERMDRLSMFLMALLFGFPVKELESFLRKYPLHRKSRDLMHEYRSLTWRARRALAAGSRSAGSVAEVLSGRPLEWVVFLLSRLDEPRQQALVRHFLTKNRFVRPDVSGDDLIEAGHFPSPGFAPALREALRAKIDGRAKGVHSQIRIALSALQRWEAQHPADERDTDPPK